MSSQQDFKERFVCFDSAKVHLPYALYIRKISISDQLYKYTTFFTIANRKSVLEYIFRELRADSVSLLSVNHLVVILD